VAKITGRMITDRWIAAFEKEKPYTPSEKRLMGIKLSQLKKNIKAHVESTGRQTDLSIEQIIMDALEFSVMTKKPYRSIASLGYEVLDPSLDYWDKRRKLESLKKEEEVNQTQYCVDKEKCPDEVIKNSHNNDIPNQTPTWLNVEDW
jgi:hypothetical protein